MRSSGSRVARASEVRADCSTAPWRHVTIGFFGYLAPSVLIGIGTHQLLKVIGIEASTDTIGVVTVVCVGIALWRGGTVVAAARPDGLRVRNRWRQLVVPWHQITSVEIGSSISYGVFDFAKDTHDDFTDNSSDTSDDERQQKIDVLLITRPGRRRRLPIYATLGFTKHLDEMQPFLEAVEAHGVPVTLERTAWSETAATDSPAADDATPDDPPRPAQPPERTA